LSENCLNLCKTVLNECLLKKDIKCKLKVGSNNKKKIIEIEDVYEYDKIKGF